MRRTNSASRHILVAGIAGACLLGAGAGLWARPADEDQRRPAQVAKAAVAKPRGKLEIVLNDAGGALAPAAAVTAATTGPTVSAELLEPVAPAAEAPPLAPVRPPEGLMRVQDPGPQPAEAPPSVAERQAQAEVSAKAAKLRVEKARLAKAKAEKLRLQKAKAKAEAKRTAELKVARAEKAEKLKDVRVAEDAAIEVAEVKKPGRLSRLKTVIAKPFKARKAEPAAAADTELAKADELKATRKPKKTADVKLAKAEPPKAAKKAASKRCVSSDPGEAIVCADPALAAADRQLSRAYREAEAAGVPAWQLRQQQQRWVAARAAAAREAPWAVHDVYLARIAELNDMTRDARRDYRSEGGI